MGILNKLNKIQTELKVPKSRTNSFGNYSYRNCEDIMEAIKPLLEKYKCVLLVNNDVSFKEGRYYVEATATLYDAEETDLTKNSVSVKAQAREEEEKKGMSAAQITGSSISYARKYALGGLFDIDDTEDDDSKDNNEEMPKPELKPKSFVQTEIEKLVKQYGAEKVGVAAKQLNLNSKTMTIEDLDKLTSVLTEQEIRE